MTTPELLEKATKRPWFLSTTNLYAEGRDDGANVCTCGEPRASTTVGFTPLEITSKDLPEAYANAELIARAVNSFEASRDALQRAQKALKESRRHLPSHGTYAEESAMLAVEEALALSEGKEPREEGRAQ